MERPFFDALTKCKQCSVGQYISKGGINSYTPDDNLCFYIQHEEDCFLYGVFDPENGNNAAHLIMRKLVAELLFQPLTTKSSHDEIISLLSDAFTNSEKFYMESYDGLVAERTSLQYQLQAAVKDEIARSRIISRLRVIDRELSAGCAAAVVILIGDRLFVANVGDLRVLLLKTNADSVLRVVQLSVDHNLDNSDEVARLNGIGMKSSDIIKEGIIGNTAMSRCLGNFLVKVLYRAFAPYVLAPPVMSSPDIAGPVVVYDSVRYMVLVSSGVYKRLQEMSGECEQANRQLAQIIIENVRKQNDFYSVAQAVLNEIESKFVHYCESRNLQPKSDSHMTLLIRKLDSVATDTGSGSKPPDSAVTSNSIAESVAKTIFSQSSGEVTTTNTSETASSNELGPPPARIKAYVDFSNFYELVEKAKEEGKLHPEIEC